MLDQHLLQLFSQIFIEKTLLGLYSSPEKDIADDVEEQIPKGRGRGGRGRGRGARENVGEETDAE